MKFRFSPLRILLILIHLLFGADVYKSLLIRLLRGLFKTDLKVHAKVFVADCLNEKVIIETEELICESRDSDHSLVLCSNSIDPVVNAVGVALDVDEVICTTVEYKEGICTGRILNEIGNKKLKAIEELMQHPQIVRAVSDNYGDFELLAEANEGIAVIHRSKDAEFWNGKPVKVLDLRK